MKIYLSGLNNVSTPEILEFVLGRRANVLLSYFHHLRQNPVVIRYRWNGCGLFIDSGGFSARMYNAPIDIYKYRDFLLALKQYDACANLDPLCLKETTRNMAILEKAGIRPWPVYHPTEFDDQRYRDLIESWCRDYEGVCVSGVAFSAQAYTTSKARKRRDGSIISPFHDYVFEHATQHKTKVHGLAATNQTLLKQYPFYSADSTTWKNSDRYGVVHEFVNGKLIHHAGVRTSTGRTRNVGTTMPKTKRMIKSLEAWMKYESYLTQLWKKRGVSWE